MNVAIEGRQIGPDFPPYLIAELSGNHNGSLARALELITAAADAGVDAIKLQTYTADTMTIDFDGPGFSIHGGIWDGRKLYELYQEAATPWEWHEDLFAHAKKLGTTIFSTPFDPTAVDFLEALNVPAYKIASFEATDIPLIERVASLGKPMIVSTGLADRDEIEQAVQAIKASGNNQIILLHCVSSYPAPAAESNLAMIPALRRDFGCVTGLSDHSLGTAVSVASVPIGACVIEKHVTLRRADGGPDAAFSLEPSELRSLVTDVRDAWESIGQANYERVSSEEKSLAFRRSLYVVRDINAGEVLDAENVRCIRPGFGLPPRHLPDVLGRKASSDLKRGTPLKASMFD